LRKKMIMIWWWWEGHRDRGVTVL
jgi:CO dehydrogenase maturation factor